MPINSCQKGKAAEREVAELLRSFGYCARRGQQFSGSPDSPDVVHDMGKFHLEVKRVENLSLYTALEQATRDKAQSEIPVVIHRRSNKPWVVIMTASDWLTQLKETAALREKAERYDMLCD